MPRRPADWSRPQIDFVDPRTQPRVGVKTRGELPHLYKECGSYFVTFRLWDAVTPPEQRRAWLDSLRKSADASRADDPAVACRLAESTEPPLALGGCLLDRPDAAIIVQDTLLHSHGECYLLASWCVMPNHVHAAYTALAGHTPASIHQQWKSYSSRTVNRLCGRRGTLWERESFDHLIRSAAHYDAYIDYIEQNPVEAKLCAKPEDWMYSSAGCVARQK